MRWAIVASAAVLGLAACSSGQSSSSASPTPLALNQTPSPVQEFPSPSPVSALSGQMNITGGLTSTFSYSTPPPCQVVDQQGQPTTLSNAVEVVINFGQGPTSVQIMIRGWHGAGTYAPNSLGNESYVLYTPGLWMSAQGTIDVQDSRAAIVSGTVDADLTAPAQAASGSRGAPAHISGTWACIPPAG
jgi:ABC-type Fe3+-hydroxamate transport system substrate-binding protein